MLRFLIVSAAVANAAMFASYFDVGCENMIVNSYAFQDVCTWSSNRYSGSYALALNSCSGTDLEVKVFNLSDSASCAGDNFSIYRLNSSCIQLNDIFIKALDFACNSNNNAFNIITHFTADCNDGGYAFSMMLGLQSCLGGSFLPGIWDYDARANYTDSFYNLQIFNSSNGKCENSIAEFVTNGFPALCMKPNNPFFGISIDVYQSFSV